MNLWKETVAKLEKHGKTVADIKFVYTMGTKAVLYKPKRVIL